MTNEQITQISHEQSATSLTPEIEALSAVYPDFDYEKESENKEFTNLIEAGITLKHAYECLHLEELLSKDRPCDSVSRSEGTSALGIEGTALWQSDRTEREKIEKSALGGHRICL